MKKRILKTVAVLMMLALTATSAVYAETAAATSSVPSDVAGTEFETAVKALVDKEIITGDTDGLFHPDSNLTRAQASIIVVKAMNPPAIEVTGTATQSVAKSGFSDMTGYGWAEGYISYAVKHGVAKGYPDGTFKPGNNVTGNELITMVLRAAGYTDESLGGTWPANYVDKGIELKLFQNIPAMHAYATKWMAAEFTYNALSLIEKANPAPAPVPETPAGIPDTSAMTFAKASFNSEMTSFNGKTIADDVKIYTYRLEKDYSASMTFSKNARDYSRDTVLKYKNTETPAFYQTENGEIVSMVLPRDVGFSGWAYSVINGTFSTLSAKDEAVPGLKTLTAGQEIKWAGEKGLTGIPAKTGIDSYLNGTLYELSISDGVITDINTVADHQGKYFREVTGSDFVGVNSYKNGIVKVTGDKLYQIKNNATIYVMDAEDPTEYEVGKQSDIKAGNEVRIYDISDDGKNSGDIVIVMAN